MSKLFDAVRATFLFTILTTPMSHVIPVNAEQSSRMSAAVVVNASPKSVWDAIRSPNPAFDHRKVLSVGNGEALVEETFDDLPIIHSSICVIKEIETPYRRIDYVMVKSDKLKALAGSWIITPLKDGRTTVELQSSLDSGVHMPFARKIADDVTLKKCKQRLALVKEIAETSEHRVASKLD